MKKKAQVTPFIIAGLVVLIMFVVLYNYKVENSEIDASNIQDESLLPLSTYVKDLTQSLVKEEVAKISFLGNLPDREKTEMVLEGYTTFNDLGLNYYAWDYQHSLSKEDVEEYLRNTISLKLNDIFEDEYLSKFYNIKEETENLVVQVAIKEDVIQIHLYKKLSVTKLKDNSVAQINDFFVSVESDFGKVLEESTRIYNYLVNDSILEVFAMQPIYTGDFHVEGMEFECIQKSFSVNELRNKYDELSQQHFELLNYDYYIDALSDTFEYKDYYSTYAIETENQDFSLDVKLFNTLEFSATPSDNGYIKPLSTSMESDFMSLFCMNIYHEFYSIKQPLIIDLHYENSMFRLPLLIDISNNEPKKSRNIIYMDESEKYVQSFCDNKNEDETTIVVVDAITDDALDNVSITTKCLGYYTCSSGSTAQGNEYSIPYLKSYLPACEKYEFILSKDGYDITHIDVEKKNQYRLEINPLVEVNVDYNFVTKMSDDSIITNYKSDLNSDEFISLKYGTDYKIINSTNKTIYIPYTDGVYAMKAILTDNQGNIKYYSEKILNISIMDFTDNNNLDFTLYGLENLDTTNDESVVELMNYASENKGEIRIR